MQEVTLLEVASHNTVEDFWTVIHGAVYDMSSFAPTHPGGSIIMLAAGTDCTVMFEQYHLRSQAALANVLNRKVAALKGKSPTMGPMYTELQRRVAERLSREPKRPRCVQVLFLLDVLAAVVALVWAIRATAATPTWQLILAPPAINVLLLRLFGQAHALGHMQIWPATSVTFWRRLLTALGSPGVGLATIPVSSENPRKMLNEPRPTSQFEFSDGRGMCEHQSVHHVRGAELEHDQCYKVCTMGGLIRLSAPQARLTVNTLQRYQPYLMLTGLFSDWFLPVVAVIERVAFLSHTWVPRALWCEIGASILGILASCAFFRAISLLLARGVGGVACFVCVQVLKQYLFASNAELFFAQHAWDNEVGEETVNLDWGRHNAETSVSLRGMARHPVCWGTPQMAGATPSTLTYHLEHTLFPGVAYANLPKIAGIVDATCAEFGVGCDSLAGGSRLRRRWTTKLAYYAGAETKAFGISSIVDAVQELYQALVVLVTAS